MVKTTCAEVSLAVLDIAFPEGFGVARIGEFVCFAPGALPGDVVRVKMAKESRRFGYARVVAVEKESPFRVSPKCPHAGLCGGCVLQGLQYEKQLELKQNYLLQTLWRIGDVRLEGVEVAPIVPSVEQYYYRSKVELFFANQGEVTVGFKERVSPLEPYTERLVPIRQCPIFSRSLERLLPIFVEYAGRVCAGVHEKHGPVLRKLIVRETKWNRRLMVNLVVSGNDAPDLTWLTRQLEKEVPEIASLWVTTRRGKDLLVGTEYLEEKLGQQTFRVYPQTFFQPNVGTAEKLYGSIAQLCDTTKSERILGLYCGAGTLEISLSPFARTIVGIDSDPENIAAAIENCRVNGLRNCQFYRQSVERASRVGFSGPFGLIIVDPPRAGLTSDALTFIKGKGVPRIIYVSCNPSTLARDLKRLREARYVPRKIQPFDFFPHGAHLETLVLLESR